MLKNINSYPVLDQNQNTFGQGGKGKSMNS